MRPREAERHLAELTRYFPVLGITGQRPSGKTTLARAFAPDKPYVSLENPDVLWSAEADPRGFLQRYPEGAIFDEAQRFPALFSYLQQIVDEASSPGRWLLTGSWQCGLRSSISQSLAGRVGMLQLLPVSTREWFGKDLPPIDELLCDGLYPPKLDRAIPVGMFMSQYVATYVERDIREVLTLRDVATFSRFVRLCAGRAGQLLNLSALGAEASVTHSTAKTWLDVLEASYIIVRLPPWHENFGKRIVKTPKLYFVDTGLLCWLLGIRDTDQLSTHAMRGAIFENWVITEVLKARANRGVVPDLYFFRDHQGNEVDLLIHDSGNLHAVEIKSGATLNADYCRGLTTSAATAGVRCASQHLVFGGSGNHVQNGISLHGWQTFAVEPSIVAMPVTAPG